MPSLISRLVLLLICLYFFAHAAYGLLNWQDYLGARPHLIRYFIAPVGLAAVFFLFAFLLKRQNRLLIGIYTVSLILALYMVEYYLAHQFYFARPKVVDERSIVADVDLGFTPNRLNGHLQTAALDDAIMGHIPFTTIELCSVDYGPARLHTDRYGLNNPDEVHDQPVHVAVTGDSFVHGHCQPPGKDFVSLVREKVPATANMGLTGTGPLFQLAVIGRQVAAVRPDHVIACFYEGNDLNDLQGELNNPWLPGGLVKGADFGPAPAKAERLAEVADLNRRYAAGEELDPWLMGALRTDIGWRDLLSNRLMLRNFAALNLTTGMLGLSYGRSPSHLEEYRATLARAREIVESWDGRLHLCYLPTRRRFGVITSHYAFDEIRNRVLAIATDLDLGVFDVTDAIAAHAEPRTLFASDGHLSIEGAALVADQLADYLADLTPSAPTTTP